MNTTDIDVAAIKDRQQRTWASGDYAAVAARIVLIAEQLADGADLRAGDTVLDVATGSGNAALAAARCGCRVTGVDYVPALLERGRLRAEAEGLEVRFQLGDAERLPFEDGDFDAVLSCLGVMFTPDHEQAASELVRVCRPGGTIAVANWTPTSFVGGMFRTVSAHVPPPAGLQPPGLWGTEERVRELLGSAVTELRFTPRRFTFRFRSPVDFVDFFRDHYGPVRRAFEAAENPEQLHADLVALVCEHDRSTGSTVAIPSEYLEAVAVKR
jgi:SAM-dependent methyltransferase